MKSKVLVILCIGSLSILSNSIFSGSLAYCQDDVTALKDKLKQISLLSSNTYFINHCASFLEVIDSKAELTSADIALLTEAYKAFSDESVPGYASQLTSYLNRQRPFIISWTSPTDGEVSFSWLKLPANWDPSKEYPLYIELHGLWRVANNPIEYLTYPFIQDASNNFAFEDGYLLSPWGRGNYWYKGISETDIWECMSELEGMVKIDPSRKYLCGHSMGGFGAWYIGSKSVNTWAALGIHAGALWYDQRVLSDDVFETLKDIPVYFVVGTNDGLYSINLQAYNQLVAEGIENTDFVSFSGGHEYLAENVQNMYLWMKDFTNDDWPTGTDPKGRAGSLKEYVRCIPNPVREDARIVYCITKPSLVSLELINVNGEIVKSLDQGYRHAGEHKLVFTAANLPAGTYSCNMKINGSINSIKMVIIE